MLKYVVHDLLQVMPAQDILTIRICVGRELPSLVPGQTDPIKETMFPLNSSPVFLAENGCDTFIIQQTHLYVSFLEL